MLDGATAQVDSRLVRGVPGPPEPAAPDAGDSAEDEKGNSALPDTSLIEAVEDVETALPPPRKPGQPQPSRAGSRWAAFAGFLSVAGALVFVIAELRPGLIFGPGMDVGGDNGGHIAAPYFLIHHLLPHLQLTGWDPWWFDGFPLYVFYFPLPALFVAILTLVAPYAVAFKIVTALGAVTLPVAGYAFGRLAGFRRPVPALMAVAMLPYLFNTSYTIDGGNLASTMAGEFSFSLAISFGLAFLGVVVYSLRTGRLRWLAAVLFAITCLCHVIPALAFGAVALVVSLVSLRRARLVSGLKVIVPIGVVGGLLAAWWLLPFGADLQYSSSMNYSPVGGPGWFSHNFLPLDYLFVLIPAGIGAILSVFGRNRVAFVLALGAFGSVACFHYLPSGLVYNARWLPFWFLFASLLAAYGVGQLARLLGRLAAPSVMAVAMTVLATLGALVGSVFAGGLEGSGFLGLSVPPNHTQVAGWIEWNYSGIQARSGWQDWKGIVSLLDRAGRRYGCGRLQYEYLSETTDPFGSTEEMMSIPLWTRGCMKPTDGIYFESSTTTPFHFLNVSEVSQDGEAPDPVAGLDYPGFNLPDGIRHLQLMGVRYFLAMSPPVEAVAATDPNLVRIGSAPSFPGPYNKLAVKHPHVVLYLIRHSPLVVGLRHLPIVEAGSAKAWLNTNLRWYEDERAWSTLLARSGPATWPRAGSGRIISASAGVPTEPITVSHVRTTTSSISFDVSRTGVPVLVKIPYFPNWQASGATGPYEVSPNLMAVVPRSHHVALRYGTSTADWAGRGASALGVVGLGALMSARRPAPALPDEPAAPPLAALPEEEGPDEEDDSLVLLGLAPPPSPSEEGIDLSVVLPAFNEEELLESTTNALVEAIGAAGRRFEVLIIENGSTDGTPALARRLTNLAPVRLVRMMEADYGEALRTGFVSSRGRVVVNFDVDYFDLDFLDKAVGAIEAGEAAVVLASKRAPGSKDTRPLRRRLLTAGFTVLMRSLLSVPVSDAHGMKALERSTLSPIVGQTELGGALYDVELVTRTKRAGLAVLELPAAVREVRPARTSVWRRSLDSLLGLVKLRFILGPKGPV